jgi:methanogenic corrinoid protein MtbC1
MTGGASPAIEPLAGLRDRYVELQLQGDRRVALRFIDALLRQGFSVPDVQEHVIADAQRQIGRLWQESRIGVAQEHIATAISEVALAHVYEHAHPSTARGKKVVVACVEGELHDLPARLVADALDLAGYDARFLGADVPTDSLIAVLDQQRPDLLALSITMSFHVPALRRQVPLVRKHTGGKLPIAIGGLACSQLESIARDVGADFTAPGAHAMVRAAGRLLGA